MYLCKGYMASTLQKVVIPNIALCFILCLYTLRSSFVLITLQVTLTFICGMKFHYFNKHFTIIPYTNCHNLVTTLQGCSKVTMTQLFMYGLTVIIFWVGADQAKCNWPLTPDLEPCRLLKIYTSDSDRLFILTALPVMKTAGKHFNHLLAMATLHNECTGIARPFSVQGVINQR